jgi:hypothetical protein
MRLGRTVGDVGAAILRGLNHLSAVLADLVLMDLQCAPALLDKSEKPTAATKEMLEIIEMIATEHDVASFRRFAIMRHWHVDRGIPFDQMISNFDHCGDRTGLTVSRAARLGKPYPFIERDALSRNAPSPISCQALLQSWNSYAIMSLRRILLQSVAF